VTRRKRLELADLLNDVVNGYTKNGYTNAGRHLVLVRPVFGGMRLDEADEIVRIAELCDMYAISAWESGNMDDCWVYVWW
jgi:hypothetical protein